MPTTANKIIFWNTDDLDFFTRKVSPLVEDFDSFREILTSIGTVIISQDITESYGRLFIALEEQQDLTLKIEFARDVSARMAPPEIHGHIVVDSFEDIAVNKVCTVLSRLEPKDFCDLIFILRDSRYALEYLIGRAGQKEVAFDT